MGILARRRWSLLLTVPVLLMLAQSLPATATPQIELFEEKIKAGLIYNFLKYTTWPGTTATTQKSSLKVCLFGANPVNGYLDPLAGKYAQQFLIDIVQVRSVQETSQCSVVFISNSEKSNLSDFLNFIDGKNILTISDIQQFAQQGGMIELAKENQRIVFYINTDAVKHAGLGIEPRLLKLAKIIPG